MYTVCAAVSLESTSISFLQLAGLTSADLLMCGAEEQTWGRRRMGKKRFPIVIQLMLNFLPAVADYYPKKVHFFAVVLGKISLSQVWCSNNGAL